MFKIQKNTILVAALVLTGGVTTAQVGINNQSPKATLDVTAKKVDGSTPEGLIAPRLTGDQIKAADAQYGTAQKGTMVYATAAVTAASTKTTAITAEGYYYFDGSLWQKVANGSTYSGSSSVVINGSAFERATLTGDVTATQNSNATTIAPGVVNSGKIADGTVANIDLANGTGGIYKGSGSLSGDTTVSQGSGSLNFNSTATTGTSHFTVDGNTLNVDAVNNNVGIGTSTPTTKLDISSGEARVGASAGTQTRVGAGFVDFYDSSGVKKANIQANNANGDLFVNNLSSNTLINPNAGNVGVGTAAPTTKLEVNSGAVPGALKIVDGTQGNGKVLTSDANGVAKWETSPFTSVILGFFQQGAGIVTTGDNSGNLFKYTGIYIDLPYGSWVVNSGFSVLSNYDFRLLYYLSTSTTSIQRTGVTFLGTGSNGGRVSGPSTAYTNDYSFVNGSNLINVTAPSVRLYLIADNNNYIGSSYSWTMNTNYFENYLYAIPITK